VASAFLGVVCGISIDIMWNFKPRPMGARSQVDGRLPLREPRPNGKVLVPPRIVFPLPLRLLTICVSFLDGLPCHRLGEPRLVGNQEQPRHSPGLT
jgi:hypothetical protein